MESTPRLRGAMLSWNPVGNYPMLSNAARTIGILFSAIALGCTPDVPDDDDTSGDDDGGIVAPVLPRIVLEKPARASFHPAGSQVEIAGQCIPGDAPLAQLTIDDEVIKLADDGSFSHILTSVPGINVVQLRVEDSDDERATEALGYHYGPTVVPAEQLTNIGVIHASAALLDDDNPDLDDTASLIEGLLEDPSTFEGLLAPMEDEYLVLTPTSMEVSTADVDLDPYSGALSTSMALWGLHVTFDAEGTGMWSWVSVSGEMWADPATIEMDMDVSASGGDVQVAVTYVDVTLDGFVLTVEYVPDFLEPYLGDLVQGYVEDALRQTAEDMVGEFLGGFLEAFAVDLEFGEENPVTLELDLGSVQLDSTGITMWLDGRTTGEVAFAMPDWAGSLTTSGTPPDMPYSAKPLNVAVDDDFVNQLFFTLWYAGALSGWEFGEAELALMGSGDIPPPLGPVQEVAVGLQLPLVITGTEVEGFDFDLGVGEVHSTITRTDGTQMGFATNIHGGASLMVAADGSLTLTMDDRPAELEIGVGVLQHPAVLDPGDLAALMRLIVPPMLSQANEAFPGFPLPETELSDLVDIDYFQGKTLEVTDLGLDITGNEDLWIRIDGGLLVQ